MPQAEAGQQLGEQSAYAREQGMDQVLTYVSGGNGNGQIQYQCFSQPGKTTAQSTWAIRKFVYDSSNRLSDIEWANGSDEFDKACDSRTTYTYSH